MVAAGLRPDKTLVELNDRLSFVEDGKQVVPEIKSLAATGHSPGHTSMRSKITTRR
jgi:hypothetical protein